MTIGNRQRSQLTFDLSAKLTLIGLQTILKEKRGPIEVKYHMGYYF